MASNYWNTALGDLHLRIRAINYNHEPITLQGNTLGAVQMGETWFDGKSWWALCPQCNGNKIVDFRGAIPDPHRRGLRPGEEKSCFRCNRHGRFKLPFPEHYLQTCWAWCLLRLEQGKGEEIYAMATSQRDHCLKNQFPFQKPVHDFWQEILRVDSPSEAGFLDEVWAKRGQVTFERHMVREAAFKVADSQIEFDIMVYMTQAMEKANEG